MRALILVLGMLIAGCSQVPVDGPGIKECEDYVIAKLRSPTTYKRIKASGIGIPYDAPKYYSVTVEYDAANAYGTPIRETQFCKFPVKSKLPVVDNYIDFDSEQAGETENMVSNLIGSD